MADPKLVKRLHDAAMESLTLMAEATERLHIEYPRQTGESYRIVAVKGGEALIAAGPTFIDTIIEACSLVANAGGP